MTKQIQPFNSVVIPTLSQCQKHLSNLRLMGIASNISLRPEIPLSTIAHEQLVRRLSEENYSRANSTFAVDTSLGKVRGW